MSFYRLELASDVSRQKIERDSIQANNLRMNCIIVNSILMPILLLNYIIKRCNNKQYEINTQNGCLHSIYMFLSAIEILLTISLFLSTIALTLFNFHVALSKDSRVNGLCLASLVSIF